VIRSRCTAGALLRERSGSAQKKVVARCRPARRDLFPARHRCGPGLRGGARGAHVLPGGIAQVGSCCQSGTKPAGLPRVVAAVSNGHFAAVPLAIR
jgi:hypothetical protein